LGESKLDVELRSGVPAVVSKASTQHQVRGRELQCRLRGKKKKKKETGRNGNGKSDRICHLHRGHKKGKNLRVKQGTDNDAIPEKLPQNWLAN